MAGMGIVSMREIMKILIGDIRSIVKRSNDSQTGESGAVFFGF